MSILVTGLCFSYREHKVLQNVSFTAETGRLTAVMGPNGAGKSTLFKCVLGLLKDYTGNIEIDGEKAGGMPARELARRVAYIPQYQPQAFSYSVIDMVLMGTSHMVSPLTVPRQDQLETAYAAMKRAGVSELAMKSFSRLSGGERQLVMIARALAQSARTLIMDEPTSSLDYGNQSRVLRLVRSLAGDGYTVLLSTHDPQHALWYADSVLALKNGSTAAFGEAKKVVAPELIKRLYGVDVSFIESGGKCVLSPSEDC